jgi:hypothetical protein
MLASSFLIFQPEHNNNIRTAEERHSTQTSENCNGQDDTYRLKIVCAIDIRLTFPPRSPPRCSVRVPAEVQRLISETYLGEEQFSTIPIRHGFKFGFLYTGS